MDPLTSSLTFLGGDGRYWLFAIGFVIGAFVMSVKKLTAIVSLLLWFTKELAGPGLVFLQAGLIAGYLSRAF